MTLVARRIAAFFWARRWVAVAIAIVLAVGIGCEPYPDGHWLK